MSIFIPKEFTYGSPRILGKSEYNVYAGKFCSIAKGVDVYMAIDHNTSFISMYPFNIKWKQSGITGHPKSKGDVHIGNDVWIGKGVIIMSGITIGDGAAIAAMSIVTRDVPPYSVVAGNPATIKKFRFNENEIEFLLKLKWWDWSDNVIEQAIPILMSGNVDKLKDYAKERGYNV